MVFNVCGNNYTKNFIDTFGEENTVMVSPDLENEINELAEDEKKNYMDMIGLKDTGLSMLIQRAIKY